MDWQIKKRRVHTVLHKPFSHKLPNGQNQYFPPKPEKAYVAFKSTIVRNRVGEEVVSSTQLYFDGYLLFNANDEFVVFDKDYPLVACTPFDGLKSGTGTTVVYL